MTRKVIHLITTLERAGAERMLARLMCDADRSADISHIVIALQSGGPLAAELRRAGVPVWELGMRAGRPSASAFVRLVRIGRAEAPDTVMTWLYHSDLIGTLARPFIRRPRIVWNLRGAPDDDNTSLPRNTRIVVRLLAALSRCPDAIAANSHRAIDIHQRRGFRPRRWIYLPNGFSPDVWYPDPKDRQSVRDEFDFGPDDRVLICVARVDAAKDHTNLLEASRSFLAEDPRARLLLVGKGTEDLDLPSDVGTQIHALGERSDIARLLRGADIGVLSSVTEGLPNALGEAMSSGVPILTTDVGDAALLVGEAGVVVRPGDPGALAAGALHLLRLHREDLDELGRVARERIHDQYSMHQARRAYEDVWLGE